jgi:calcineurin-like phosphoesterase family protein
MDCRGFADAEEMNNYMIEQWNKKVRWNDEVVILGDFSYGKAEETNKVLEQLKGILCLVEGNHDQFGRAKGYSTARFKWIRPYAELNDNNRKVILCHYPILCYNGQYLFDENGNPRTYMLYGHVHNTWDQRLMEQTIGLARQQTRKRPDELLNGYKAETLNKVLRPLREMMQGEEYAELLGPVIAGDEEGNGMTFGDVMILLTQYKSALTKYRRAHR